MFSSGPNYNKLKTNTRLTMNRLKLLGKKKTEQAQKARKEIADYIGQGKEDRARIRVEHIIREDYLVEALEMIEMFCDLLIARFGILQTMKEMDPGLEECIATLIYCTPRLQSDIPELKIVCDQLTLKYKKEYADACRSNHLNKVNEKVLHRLSTAPPPKILVERYLVEIARSHNVPFEPDPKVMQEDEIALAENQLGQLIDFQGLHDPSGKNPNALPNNGVLPDAEFQDFGPSPIKPGPAYPPPPGGMPFGPGPPGGPGGPGGAMGGSPFHGPGGAPNGLPYPPANLSDNALYPPENKQNGPGYPPGATGGYQGPPVHFGGAEPMPPSYNETMWNDPGASSPGGPPPLPNKGPVGGEPDANSLKPPTSNFSLPDLPGVPDSDTGLPHIPSPPRSGGVTPLGPPGGGGNDDVDLDDLTRRFEELKKRK